MLVGEVRWATTGSGSSWKLSGGSPWSSGVDECLEEAPRPARDQAEGFDVVVGQLSGGDSARRKADPTGDDGREQPQDEERRCEPDRVGFTAATTSAAADGDADAPAICR